MSCDSSTSRSIPSIPPELLATIVQSVVSSPLGSARTLWAPRTKREATDYKILARLSRVSREFYAVTRPPLFANIDISTQAEARLLLRSLKAIQSYRSKADSTAQRETDLRCLRLAFSHAPGDFDRRILLDPATVARLVGELGPEIKSLILFVESQGRFYEEEDRATDEETDMQSAINGFEDHQIDEVQIVAGAINRLHYWPRAKMRWTGADRERDYSMQLVVEGSFPNITKLSLERILFGYEAALRPPESLKHLRLIVCGRWASQVNQRQSVEPRECDANRLESLDIRVPTLMTAQLIYKMVKLHQGSLYAFTLFTSPAWIGPNDIDIPMPAPPPMPLLLNEAAFPPTGMSPTPPAATADNAARLPAHCRIGPAYLGDALAALLAPTIRDLTLGGPACVTSAVFISLRDAPNLRSLTFRGCGNYERTVGDGAQQRSEAYIDGVRSIDVAEWLRATPPQRLERLTFCAMGAEWLYRFAATDAADCLAAPEHRHPLYNRKPLDEDQRDVAEAIRRQESALHRVCRERGVALRFIERWED